MGRIAILPAAFRVGLRSAFSAGASGFAPRPPSGVLRLRAVSDPEAKFGALLQEIAPDEFKGKRVRLSGFVRTEGVSGWAGLWMRVDRKNAPVESFDNMQNRAIKGTTEWTRHEVVLDIQPDATNIACGVLQHGVGTTWVDELRMEVVDINVPTTSVSGVAPLDKPTNLDFEG